MHEENRRTVLIRHAIRSNMVQASNVLTSQSMQGRECILVVFKPCPAAPSSDSLEEVDICELLHCIHITLCLNHFLVVEEHPRLALIGNLFAYERDVMPTTAYQYIPIEVLLRITPLTQHESTPLYGKRYSASEKLQADPHRQPMAYSPPLSPLPKHQQARPLRSLLDRQDG